MMKKFDLFFFQVWEGNMKIENFDVTKTEKHGKIYDADGMAELSINSTKRQNFSLVQIESSCRRQNRCSDNDDFSL